MSQESAFREASPHDPTVIVADDGASQSRTNTRGIVEDDSAGHASRPGTPTHGKSGYGTTAPHVGLVEGSGPKFRDETTELLRRRLAAATLILVIGMAAFVVLGFVFNELPFVRLAIWPLAVVIWLLAWRGGLSRWQLRCLELCAFGLVGIQLTLEIHLLVDQAIDAGEGRFITARLVENILCWAVLLMVYSIFIPNTARRAAAVIGGALLVPLVSISTLLATSDAVRREIDPARIGDAAGLTLIAAAACVFGTYVIDSLRREAFRARRFGQYQLKERIGEGGMGEVYRAEHQLLKRPCAIKLIRPETARIDPLALARFEREVQSMARLSHWNTVEIFDYGHTADGQFYYVMEYLPGMSLSEIVKRFGPLPPERAVHFLKQTAAALVEAHGAGLVHRDIKPGNIFAAQRGGRHDVAKLLDFGLVKETAPDSVELTRVNEVAGSPSYMSPEQATRGSEPDERSDIYALGATAYFLLTGRPPFSGDSYVQVLIAHVHEPVSPPSKWRGGIPGDVEAIVLRCLNKFPTQRFNSAAELEKALAACQCAGQWTDERAAAWWNKLSAGESSASEVSAVGTLIEAEVGDQRQVVGRAT